MIEEFKEKLVSRCRVRACKVPKEFLSSLDEGRFRGGAFCNLSLRTPLGSSFCGVLWGCIAENVTLTVVDLSGCKLGDASCQAVAACLRQNRTLEHLLLEDDEIGPAGAAALAAGLRTNLYLHGLSLKGNPLGQGVKDIAEALVHHPRLASLSLCSTELERCAAGALATLLRGSRSLRRLDLSKNRLRGEAFSDLCVALMQNPPLTHLGLSGCGLQHAEGEHLAQVFHSNASLIGLDISYNTVAPNAQAAIKDALERNRPSDGLALEQALAATAAAAAAVSAGPSSSPSSAGSPRVTAMAWMDVSALHGVPPTPFSSPAGAVAAAAATTPRSTASSRARPSPSSPTPRRPVTATAAAAVGPANTSATSSFSARSSMDPLTEAASADFSKFQRLLTQHADVIASAELTMDRSQRMRLRRILSTGVELLQRADKLARHFAHRESALSRSIAAHQHEGQARGLVLSHHVVDELLAQSAVETSAIIEEERDESQRLRDALVAAEDRIALLERRLEASEALDEAVQNIEGTIEDIDTHYKSKVNQLTRRCQLAEDEIWVRDRALERAEAEISALKARLAGEL